MFHKILKTLFRSHPSWKGPSDEIFDSLFSWVALIWTLYYNPKVFSYMASISWRYLHVQKKSVMSLMLLSQPPWCNWNRRVQLDAVSMTPQSQNVFVFLIFQRFYIFFNLTRQFHNIFDKVFYTIKLYLGPRSLNYLQLDYVVWQKLWHLWKW